MKPDQHEDPLENVFSPATSKMEVLKYSLRIGSTGTIYEKDCTKGKSVI